MASISKHPTRRNYRAQIKKDGKRVSKVFGTRREAVAWAEAQESFIGTIGARTTFKQLLERYSNEVSSKKRAGPTEQKKISFFIRSNPALVNKRLVDITKQDIAAWRDRRLAETSNATVIRDWAVFSHAFKVAIHDWGLIEKSPMEFVMRPKENPPRDRIITDKEVEIMDHVASYSENSDLQTVNQRTAAALHFSIETALRAQEICNLKFSDINGRVAHITTSKTRAGIRQVPLSSRAMNIIKRLQYAKLGSERIFALTPDQLSSNFRRLKSMAKLTGFTFHDARATAITKLAKKIDILDFAKMIGHKNLGMLMVYYRESAEQLVDKLD